MTRPTLIVARRNIYWLIAAVIMQNMTWLITVVVMRNTTWLIIILVDRTESSDDSRVDECGTLWCHRETANFKSMGGMRLVIHKDHSTDAVGCIVSIVQSITA